METSPALASPTRKPGFGIVFLPLQREGFEGGCCILAWLYVFFLFCKRGVSLFLPVLSQQADVAVMFCLCVGKGLVPGSRLTGTCSSEKNLCRLQSTISLTISNRKTDRSPPFSFCPFFLLSCQVNGFLVAARGTSPAGFPVKGQKNCTETVTLPESSRRS